MHSIVVYLAVAVCVAQVLHLWYSKRQTAKWLRQIPIHEFEDDNGWHHYQNNYRQLIRSGYVKYSKNGQMFRTKNPDGGWRIVISPMHLEEIKHTSNQKLSWQRQMQENLLMKYTGAPDRPPWSAKVIRMELNKRLDDFTDYMAAQIESSFSQHLPRDTNEFREVNILHVFRQVVAQVTTRIFSSEELARDQEWTDAVNRFTADGWGAAFAVREHHPWLRYPASFFLPAVRRINEDRRFARRKLEPIFRARLADMKKPDFKAPDDGMQWLIHAANGSLSIDVLADTMIRIMMAAVHTTAQTSTCALADVLGRSDLVPELRDETQTVLGEAQSAKHVSTHLLKIESVIKESARISPLGIIMVGRKVVQSHLFNDGTFIPAGNSIFSPTEAVGHDPEVYANPDSFDGLRFYRMRHEGGPADFTKWMLGNAVEESTGFGYGAQACPGRWFAAREMVLMFAKVFGDYEIKWSPANSGPPESAYQERALKAPTSHRMLVKMRPEGERAFSNWHAAKRQV